MLSARRFDDASHYGGRPKRFIRKPACFDQVS